MIELLSLVLAMDVYTESNPGAPQPRFDLPEVFYCCTGQDFIYTETRPHVAVAVFTHWTDLPFTGAFEVVSIVQTPFVLQAELLEDLPPGHHTIDVRAYTSDGVWVGWLADDITVTCPGDATMDQIVDVQDLLSVLGNWGTSSSDMDQDGQTGVSELLAVLSGWGACGGS